jgi:hypothetical protein
VSLGSYNGNPTWIVNDNVSIPCDISGIAGIVQTGTFTHSFDFLPYVCTVPGFLSVNSNISGNVPLFLIAGPLDVYFFIGSQFLYARGDGLFFVPFTWTTLTARCVSWVCTVNNIPGSTKTFASTTPSASVATIGTVMPYVIWPGEVQRVSWSNPTPQPTAQPTTPTPTEVPSVVPTTIPVSDSSSTIEVSAPVIIGIVGAGLLAGVAVTVCVACYICRRRPKSRASPPREGMSSIQLASDDSNAPPNATAAETGDREQTEGR